MTAAARRVEPTNRAEHFRAVGAMVRAKRLNRGLSQADLAAGIGVTHVMVHHVESGRSRMPRARIAAAAELLGLDPQAFAEPSLAAQDADEADLLVGFRHLREDERAALLALVRS